MKASKMLLSAAILLLSGCNLFNTREPDEPKGQADWNYFPITSEQTLENLEYAFSFNANADKYGSILADDFRFYFDARDVRDYSLPAYWDKETEVSMRNLMSVEVEIELQEIDDQEDTIQSDRVTYNRHYEVIAAADEFKGSLTLNLRREEDGFWRVYRWEDYRKDSEYSWGRLKHEYAP